MVNGNTSKANKVVKSLTAVILHTSTQGINLVPSDDVVGTNCCVMSFVSDNRISAEFHPV